MARTVGCLARVLGVVAVVLAGLLTISQPMAAGELDEAALAKRFPDPYVIGERDAELPMWPLLRRSKDGAEELAGYLFETIDLAPLPGYAGMPANLLVAISPDGTFIGVELVSHQEPIFHKGVREEQLYEFVEQYRGLSYLKNIKIGAPRGGGERQSSTSAVIDGVARATLSVGVINDSVLAASHKIARAKLGLSAVAAGTPRRLKPDDGSTISDGELLAKNYLFRGVIENGDVEKEFGPAFPRDIDGGPRVDPKAANSEVWIAYLSAPQLGRSVLGGAGYAYMLSEFPKGDHVILVATRGRYGFQGPDYRPGSVPDRLALQQDGLALSMIDTSFLHGLQTGALPKDAAWSVLRIPSSSGFDPSRPFQISLRIARQNNEIFPKVALKDFTVTYPPPDALFEPAEAELKGWRAIWYKQRPHVGLALFAVLLLTVSLLNPKRMVANPAGFGAFRLVFLAFTLCGIGWWAQGQLSILNIIAAINALKASGEFGYLLFDPVSLLLWAFVLITLVFWGRGTFCGWLCPFGALQELVSVAARKLGVRQVQVPYALDRKLRLVKYAVLAVIGVTALFSTPLSETLAEVEPFKTAITLGFDRSWPFVAYAGALLLLSAFVFKGFCLYLCPLGAALALLGRARRLDWIPRRSECGSPCQLCNVRCRFGAIEPTGEVKYDECFQCMDCVVIYHDPKTCVPEVLARKGRTLPVPRPKNTASEKHKTRETVS